MKTEFEAASMVSNIVNSGNGVTDFPIAMAQIQDELDTLRVRVFEDLDSKGLIKRPYSNWVQTIDFSATSKTVVTAISPAQRYVDIPRIVFLGDGSPAIAYIGAADGMKSFRIVYGIHRETHLKDRWIGNAPTAIITENGDNYRVFFKNINPTTLKLIGVFNDPSDLEQYGYNGDITSNDGGSAYPMPAGQLDVIIGKTAESYLRTMYRVRPQGDQAVDSPNLQKEQNA